LKADLEEYKDQSQTSGEAKVALERQKKKLEDDLGDAKDKRNCLKWKMKDKTLGPASRQLEQELADTEGL